MRQLPNYLLIGNGRVAKHMAQYFKLLNLTFQSWHRGQSEACLNAILPKATHVLLLISDSAIQHFANEHLRNHQGIHIHFSGSVISANIFGAHPLQTFNYGVYTLEDYQAIPFIVDENAPDFAELLPGLNNPHAKLSQDNKAKYHTLCVLSGNFTCLLWQKMFNDMEKELHIPKEMAFEYLKRQTHNLLTDAEHALTGPLVRGETETIAKHLNVLNRDDFKDVYQSFVNYYAKLHTKELV